MDISIIDRNDKFVNWDNTTPGISFNFEYGRITIFKTTLAVLGFSEFYRFLYNPKALQLAIEACNMDSQGAQALKNINPDESYNIKSVGFVRMLYAGCGWDKTMSYRVPGIPYVAQHLVDFKLSDALEIFEGKVKEFDLPKSIPVEHTTSRD